MGNWKRLRYGEARRLGRNIGQAILDRKLSPERPIAIISGNDIESPTPNRHVNVSVEQLNYRPAKLSDIRRLARQLTEGRTVPGHSTRARLNVVERVIP